MYNLVKLFFAGKLLYLPFLPTTNESYINASADAAGHNHDPAPAAHAGDWRHADVISIAGISWLRCE